MTTIMDDDVQYLGTKFATQHDIDDDDDDDPCEVLPSVTGITLHVDKCGDKPPQRLTFHRACSGYVNIGRKSGSDDRSMRRENDDHNAVFTCQVVSAKHAKLILSDSGQVYIVDLHSRHGTHLTRCGETTPGMLQPEVETLLADGDILTFGKVVGAGSYHVSPVTVRVELLTGFSSSAPSTKRTPPMSSPVLEMRPRKSSCGRYGLISAAIGESDSAKSSSCISVSSDASSSPSEQESDMEDEPSCIPVVLRDAQGKPSVKIPAFRSFIREMCHNTTLPSPSTSDIPDEPLEDVPGSPPSDVIIHISPVIVPEPLPESRSHSPILALLSPPSEAQHSEPAVIGAWPASRPDSPRHSSLEVEAGQSEVPLVPDVDPQPEPAVAPPMPTHTRISTPYPSGTLPDFVQCLHPPAPFFLGSGPFSTSIASDFGLPSVPPPPLPPPPPHRFPPFSALDKVMREATARVKGEITGSLKNVEDRITSLQETLSDLKSRQTVTEEDVVDLQSHVEMLEPDSERLLCRITGAERNIATLSTLQGQMIVLQNQVTTLRTKVDAPEPKSAETRIDDIKVCADALNSLVFGMKTLREDVEKQMEAKMEAIQNARTEALDALKGAVAEAEATLSSKRKREDEDEMEYMPEVAKSLRGSPILLDDIPLPQITVPQVPLPVSDSVVHVPALTCNISTQEILLSEPPRPYKRARTAMHTVAQTAVAMAIGAAATWSALAFS